MLPAAAAEIYGDEIAFEEPFRNIGLWHGVGDHVVWTVDLPQSAAFDVWLDLACDNAVAGNTFVFEGGDPALHDDVRKTGGWDKYRQEKIGTIALPAGTHRLTLRPDGQRLNGALMDLRSVHLVPPGQALSMPRCRPRRRFPS